nr:MAG TPA: hypothetical protein [Caudoviricetes sp.]
MHHHFYLFNNERLAQFTFSFAMYLQNGGLCEEKRRACKCVLIERGESCLPWGDTPPVCERSRPICGGCSAIGLGAAVINGGAAVINGGDAVINEVLRL